MALAGYLLTRGAVTLGMRTIMKKAIPSEDARRADGQSSRRPGKTALSKDIQSHIGRKLRTAYGQLVQEPVPAKFADLLNRLADSEQPAGGEPVRKGGREETTREPQS